MLARGLKGQKVFQESQEQTKRLYRDKWTQTFSLFLVNLDRRTSELYKYNVVKIYWYKEMQKMFDTAQLSISIYQLMQKMS